MGLPALDVRGLQWGVAASVSSLGPQLDSCYLMTSLGVEGGRLIEQRQKHGECLLSFLPFFILISSHELIVFPTKNKGEGKGKEEGR